MPVGCVVEDQARRAPWGPERHGRHRPALLLEQHAERGETETGTAVLPRAAASPMRPAAAERGPQVVVDPGRG